ncbi:RING1 and YY1-binding protein-like [Lineus longissimus]|uniref:RING1 and YY1-binding protein-like n=1 Tax=Lineus longissimus TaxID=88925 RepID=UPI002B4EFC47
MDEKRGSGRTKRQMKHHDEGKWDCSVCTFKNPPEAFKCEMCDVRKGTSTRKPRANQQIVAAQIAQQYVPPPPLKKERPDRPLQSATLSSLKLEPDDELKDEDDDGEQTDEEIIPSKERRTHLDSSSSSSTISQNSTQRRTKKLRPPRLKNIDRSSAQHMAVTVNNVTVIITDYKPKERRISGDAHHHNNNTNNTNLNSSTDLETDAVNDSIQQNGEELSDFEC